MEKNKKKHILRVSEEAERGIDAILEKLNQKEIGRRVKADDLIRFSISLLSEKQMIELQESTYSNHDRLEIAYRKYVAKHGHLEKDDFIGKLLSTNKALA